MIAEGDDGPLIPSMAAEAIIRRRLEGRRPAPGARAATRDLELTDYEALFARRQIVCGIRETPGAAMPLYRRLLGDAYAQLPAPIQALHDLADTLSVEGRRDDRARPQPGCPGDRGGGRLSAGRRERAREGAVHVARWSRGLAAQFRRPQLHQHAGGGARVDSIG